MTAFCFAVTFRYVAGHGGAAAGLSVAVPSFALLIDGYATAWLCMTSAGIKTLDGQPAVVWCGGYA